MQGDETHRQDRYRGAVRGREGRGRSAQGDLPENLRDTTHGSRRRAGLLASLGVTVGKGLMVGCLRLAGETDKQSKIFSARSGVCPSFWRSVDDLWTSSAIHIASASVHPNSSLLFHSPKRRRFITGGRTPPAPTMVVLTLWLFLFLLLGALLGVNMYSVIVLQDLTSDLINPHDCANRINQLVVPEFAMQGATSVLLFLAGTGMGWLAWCLLLIHVPITVFHAQLYLRQEHVVHVTDVFARMDVERNRRGAKMGVYVLTFVLVIYEAVSTVVNQFLTPEGKQQAAEFFKEAMTNNLHHF